MQFYRETVWVTNTIIMCEKCNDFLKIMKTHRSPVAIIQMQLSGKCGILCI